MKKKLDNIMHSKLFVIILLLVFVVTGVIVGTYAWFTWSNPSEQNTIFTMSIGEIIDIEFINGNDVNGIIDPVYSYTDGLSTSFSVNNKLKSDSFRYSYNISFDITSIDSELINEDFKYKIIRNGEVLCDGNFKDAVSGSSLILYTGILPKGEGAYTVYFYIDGNVENDINMMNKNINGYIMVNVKTHNVEDYIRDLYSSNNLTIITHKDETGNKIADYFYSKSVNLMNDGLGATVNDTTALTSGTKGNIRYYGANPNNYIYFNCDDYNNQSDSTCEKWRIIGIVDGKVKIVRDESLRYYTWDSTSTGEYDNNWHDSTLQVLLNNGYYNNSDGVSYYNNSTTPIIINFKTDKKGIKNDETKNMISESTWYLGGVSSSNIYTNKAYEYERGEAKCSSCTYDTTWTGKIGLMYPSDYGYAADLSVCNQILYNYNQINCKGKDWLYDSDYHWLITPYSSSSVHVWYVGSTGDTHYNNIANDDNGVRAALYLSSNLTIFDGEGTSDDPYRLSEISVSTGGASNRGNLKDYITNLYVNNNPTQITHYGDDGTTEIAKYYYSYMDDEKSWGIMNDGLGATVNDATALTSGAQGNIRYYGANPNNYIYFNCDDYNNQSDSTCEKWRIIGIVDGKVKIIRDESLGSYAWDLTSAGNWNNNWHDSTLQVLLNDGYYNNNDGIEYYIWDVNNGHMNVTYIDFKTNNKGIKNDKTRGMISESTWYLGGHNSSSIYANQIYGFERGDAKCSSCTYDTTWVGKIGLMYPSDYGYATDLSVCNQTLLNYNTTSNCIGTDWLFNNSYQWLITPHSSNAYYAWRVSSTGSVSHSDYVNYAYGVRTILYLDSELSIGSEGDGSSESPYQIVVS